jgi:hypothetical protein
MAVETIKSLTISNRDATPSVPTVAAIAGGNMKNAQGNVVVSASASIGSLYPMVSVPSNCRIESVVLQCAALGSGCTANIGVYAPTSPSPSLLALNSSYTANAAISATFFASGVDVSGALTPVNEISQSGTNTIAKQGQELWQALGLASDPMCMLDVSVALAAAAVAGGALGLKVGFVY